MTTDDPTPLGLRRLADLDDETLTELYAPPRRPWLRVNFVSTVDGASQGPDGLSKSINNAADKRVFASLRRRADCLVVGAGTLRAEGYAVPSLPLVVVTRTGGVPDTLRDAPPGRVLMATVATSPGLESARDQLGSDAVLVLGEEEIDLVALRDALVERGWGEILCEGGPALFADLLAAGVVDELCWTVVPTLVGGDGARIATGADVAVGLRPVLLLEEEGTLLGRWLVDPSRRFT